MATLPSGSSALPPEVALFRRTVWEARIPVVIVVDDACLPPGSDPSVDAYYTTVPRISYLPLLVPEVRRYLLAQVVPAGLLASIQDRQLSFEAGGEPLKWHWPVGVLFDAHHAARTPAAAAAAAAAAAVDGPAPALPWRLTLKIAGDKPHDKLHDTMHPPPTAELCKTHFMSMLKEADFVHYGSTKRVVNLRRQEQDSLWEAIVEYNFDKYWTVASKVYPPPSFVAGVGGALRRPAVGTPGEEKSVRSALTTHANESQASIPGSLHSVAISEAPSMAPSGSGAAAAASASASASASAGTAGVRTIPMRFHLPDNAGMAQEAVSPVSEDGKSPATLGSALTALFPQLFPLAAGAGSAPASAFIHGVQIPLDAQLYWLGVAFTGADGWLSVVIHITV